MWRRASGLRRGFTSQFDSTDIIDDMAAATGRPPSSCAAAGCAPPFASSLLWERRSGCGRGCGRGLGPRRTEDRDDGLALYYGP